VNMSEYREAVKIMGREYRADDFELGAELHGWKVVTMWDKKYFHWTGSVEPDPWPSVLQVAREPARKPDLVEVMGGSFWETIRKWGGSLLIGIGLVQLVFGPYHLAAAFFIPGGLLILIVQYFANRRR
jgi:hypothetical protein